jgi:hypothetical protein
MNSRFRDSECGLQTTGMGREAAVYRSLHATVAESTIDASGRFFDHPHYAKLLLKAHNRLR